MWSKGSAPVRLVDLLAFGRPVRLIWHTWRWCCGVSAQTIYNWRNRDLVDGWRQTAARACALEVAVAVVRRDCVVPGPAR